MRIWNWKTNLYGVFMSLNFINLYLLYLFTLLFSSVQSSTQSCPSSVPMEADKCLTEFSGQYNNIQISYTKLFSGLDVDRKRAFCDSYKGTMHCIQMLKTSCPEKLHSTIDQSIVNIHSAEAELNALCIDDILYEAPAVQSTTQSCPSSVSTKANMCLTEFSGQYRNIQISDKKLYSGLDVETIRAFCDSYKRAMHCIQMLKQSCPEKLHSTIDKSIVNIHSAEAELNALCIDDRLYEVYARNQNCFLRMGPQAETCSDRYLNSSIRPNIVASIEYKTLEELCKDIGSILDCIKHDVLTNCGEEAASIVEVLVKASYRKSSQCNYVEVQLKQQPNSAPVERNVKPKNRKQQQTRATDTSFPNSSYKVSCDVLLLCLVTFISCSYSTRRK